MNVQLTLDPLAHADSAWICSDRERLRQVLLNLLSNAIKYNRPGGLVRVSVLPAPPDGWCVHVLDTGCGIAPEAVKRLSQPFERIESESHAVEPGSGLGLALTYRIVQALGGTITCTSAVGKGSRFSVRFPRIASPEETPGDGGQAGLLALNSVEAVLAAPLATPRGAGGKTFSAGLSVVSAPSAVLYVEDDVANVYLLERIMESRGGVRLLSAQLGRLGLELAAEHRPKLLLLDLNLPDLTGEEFLKRLHEQPSTAGIPVVAVTGEVSTERVQGIMALGAVALLSKPYDVAELMGLIDRYVR
jgi:CheY-like chemotaxis protein